MPKLHTTREVVRAVEAQRVHSDITLESALSLPVPVMRSGRTALAFFWYVAGGPVQRRTVGAPYCRVLADPDDLGSIVFTLVEPSEFGISGPRGAPLGGPLIGGSVLPADMKQTREELYRRTDRVLEIYLRAASALSAGEEVEAAGFRSLFYRLAVVVLLPAYRALSPDFFAWLDGEAAPVSITE